MHKWLLNGNYNNNNNKNKSNALSHMPPAVWATAAQWGNAMQYYYNTAHATMVNVFMPVGYKTYLF